MRASSPGSRALPAQPVYDGPAHHALEVAALQPRQLLGEHRHALAPRARHARDVGAPEAAVGPERLEDLAQIAVDVRVGVRLGSANAASSLPALPPPMRPRWSMCSLSRGWRAAIFASAAMWPPARSPTGRPAFSAAFQNQSSEPSVHHAC